MSHIHPSRWTIKHENDKKGCQQLVLPLGSADNPPILISTKLFNKLYQLAKMPPSYLAGEFAQMLRELNARKIDLRNMDQVNIHLANACYTWLDAYELKLVEFGIKRAEEDKKVLTPPKTALAHSALYDHIMLAAALEYIKLAGPMGDAKQIAEKAKAVARACTTED